MSYRRNHYDSNRDDDRYSKQYSKKTYEPREETAYVPKGFSKKNTEQSAGQAENTYYSRNGHTEYVAKPKQEANQHSNNQDNRIKEEPHNVQEIYVPKKEQRKSGEGQALAADKIHKEGHEERKTTQYREKKPKREVPEYKTKEEIGTTQEMYVPKKGQRKSGEGSLATDKVNNEDNNKALHASKNVPKKGLNPNEQRPEENQNQGSQNRKEGHEEKKNQYREKKPKKEYQEHKGKEENHGSALAGDKLANEVHEEKRNQQQEKKPKKEYQEHDGREEKGQRPPKHKPAKEYNQTAPNQPSNPETDMKKPEDSKIQRNATKPQEKDTFVYDESLIAEITSMLHEAALEIPEQVIEKPKEIKEENKAQVVVDQNQVKEAAPVEERKGEKENVAQKKEEPKSPEKIKPNQQKEQPPKKERIKALDWISKEFYAIYKRRKGFLDLYQQLDKVWEEIYETLEDEQATYKCFQKIKPNFINSFALYVVLFFHVLAERQLFEEAVDWYYQYTNMVEKETQFGPIIYDAVGELEKKYVKSGQNGIKFRAQKKIADAVRLEDFGRKINDVNVVDKFDKSGKRFIRVGALEKIKKEDKIAVHYERNEHMKDYLATIQIATRNEVFILDLERLCKFDDNLLAVVEFFSIIFAKRSTVVIVMDAGELCQGIIKTMFMEKEKENKDFVEKKRELCQVLAKYENHFTDLLKVGVGKNIREVFQNVLGVKLDQRQRHGNWYWRPLTEDQIELAALDACGLFACYDKLFEENLGAETQTQP